MILKKLNTTWKLVFNLKYYGKVWYTYLTDLQICCLNLLMSASRLSRPWTVIFINELATYFDRALSPWRFYDKFTSKLERKMKINAFKCWKWQLKWYNYMIRSYSFQNPRAFPMACATFETTAQKTLGTLACRDIWWSSFRWNASLSQKEDTASLMVIGLHWFRRYRKKTRGGSK